MSEPVTISDLHEWIDKHAPDCRERRVLHLSLDRLFQFEVGQIPELKGKWVDSGYGEPFVAGSPVGKSE